MTGDAVQVFTDSLPTTGAPLSCKHAPYAGASSDLASDGVVGTLSVIPSVAPTLNADGTVNVAGTVGKVTIVLVMHGTSLGTQLSHFEQGSIQSTVSLRDYPFTGINQ